MQSLLLSISQSLSMDTKSRQPEAVLLLLLLLDEIIKEKKEKW